MALAIAFPTRLSFFKARRVISGDFFWHKPLNPINEEFNPTHHKMLLASIDSEGEGIPGVFLSMACINLLNEITSTGLEEPHEILSLFHKEISHKLSLLYPNSNEIITIAICIIDPLGKTVKFSGAKNQLVYIDNGKLVRLKGNKEAISEKSMYQYNGYESKIVPVSSPTWFYLFSDGFVNQIGGASAQKFSIRYFKILLEQINALPANQQRDVIIKTFDQWKQDSYQQVDDVLVIGFKLSPQSNN